MSVYRLKASITRIPISRPKYCNLLHRLSYLHLYEIHISQYTPTYSFTTNPSFHIFLSPFQLNTQPPKTSNFSILPVQINTLLHIATVSIFNVNKNPTDATVCRYLFTAKLHYMFRVSQHPSSGVLKTVPAASGTSSMTCTGGCGYSF